MKREDCVRIMARDQIESWSREDLERGYKRTLSMLPNEELEEMYNVWFAPDPPVEIE